MTLEQVLFNALRIDEWLQGLGIVASLIGVTACVWAISEITRVTAHMNALQILIARGHLVGQFAVLAVQVIWLIINVLVLTLPPIPVAMYHHSEAGAWVVVVILIRKLLRTLAILILTAASVHRVYNYHRVLQHFTSDALHFHRRTGDTP